MCRCVCVQGPEEGLGSAGARITGCRELPKVGAWTKLGYSARTNVLSHLGFSLAHNRHFLKHIWMEYRFKRTCLSRFKRTKVIYKVLLSDHNGIQLEIYCPST